MTGRNRSRVDAGQGGQGPLARQVRRPRDATTGLVSLVRRVVILVVLCALPAMARAEALWVEVDLSEQRMLVTRGDAVLGDWPVSTARAGKVTPLGLFQPQTMKEIHHSTLYDDAPMPWSIFFSGNYAIHGTDQIARLGTPASAGCIRLHPENAKALFGWVRAAGKDDTVIEVVP